MTAPCPYHNPAGPCGKERNCPVCFYEAFVDCTALSPGQIAVVQAWQEGK
jgi:hypothetical protein